MRQTVKFVRIFRGIAVDNEIMEIVPHRLDLVLELEFDLVEVPACLLNNAVDGKRATENFDVRGAFFTDSLVGRVLAVDLTCGRCGRREKLYIAVGHGGAARAGGDRVVKGELVKQGRFAAELVDDKLIHLVRHCGFRLCKCKWHN